MKQTPLRSIGRHARWTSIAILFGVTLSVGAPASGLAEGDFLSGASGAPQYSVDWHTIDGGGGTSAGGGFMLAGTVGQPDAGEMSGGNYVLVGGFWGGGATSTGEPACPADLNGDGEVNGADLGLLLNSWGIDGAADLNDDGVIDGADLGLLLNAWGPCPD